MRKIKIGLSLFLIFLLFGCNLNNTPTSKVEELLSSYQKADSDILNDGMDILSSYDSSFMDDDLRKVIKRQYKNLSYNIKDEELDGDIASVKVEIEVLDYKKVLFDDITYNSFEDKLDGFNSIKDKVVYTIIFNVSKNSNGNWRMDSLGSVDMEKLLGIY